MPLATVNFKPCLHECIHERNETELLFFSFRDQVLPAIPDFMWKFDATEVTVGVVDNNKRKRRAELVCHYICFDCLITLSYM